MPHGSDMADEYRDLWWDSPTKDHGLTLQLELPDGFQAQYGGRLERIQVSYESWGALNPARDNAVLIIHPMTADCHVTGEFQGQPRGWWEPLVGPGRAVDTDRHFVVCPNLLGGCYGTSGPRFPAPDGEPFFDRFPLLTPQDMMRVQQLFLGQFGVQRVRRVIGPSMGGMVAWEWAVEASESVDEVVVVAAPLRSSPHQIGLNWLQRRGIELDMMENEVVAQLGQMVARGVGMLSYRSPAGLEQRFGREWHQEPGATLRERGVFNIESWLRHHGKRLTRRFDPYTYILYSRAMDLHDISRNRGYLIPALARVRCRVLVVGISTDFLYPPEEVHLGADILDHLQRDVRYAEIRSPHGHDAFLLETDQLGEILRRGIEGSGAGNAGFSLGPAGKETSPGAVDVAALPQIRPIRLGILGAGRVAISFLHLLADRRQHLEERHGLAFEPAVVGEVDADRAREGVFQDLEVTYDPASVVERSDLDVIVELTRDPMVYLLLEKALSAGRPVVTPNKPLIRRHGARLEDLALKHGTRLAYHDAFATGWPLIFALERSMPRSGVLGFRCSLSSSCNVILERMEEGASLEAALAEVMARELTEPDADLDLSAWDSAQKLAIILTRLLERRVSVEDLSCRGIRDLDPELVSRAPQAGLRIKLVALARDPLRNLEAVVRPMAVRADAHLGSLRGDQHMMVLETAEAGELVFVGAGAGSMPVAQAVLSDLVGLFDRRHSWTSRFPPRGGAVAEPLFFRYLSLEGGRPVVGDKPVPGSVPVLEVGPR